MVYFNTTLDQLPELDHESSKHASRVTEYLAKQIEEHEGFIGFDQYMATVLYAPGLGYYSAGSEKFGTGGDYITAPLISPLFSRTLARFIAQHLGSGDQILELGAGTGVMAKDIIASLAESGVQADGYNILEPSAELQQRQRQMLEAVTDSGSVKVSWLDGLEEQQNFNGVIVGNEVIDAMPVQRFAIASGQVLELGVGLEARDLALKTRRARAELSELVESLLPLPLAAYPDGYSGEYRPAVDGWMQALNEYLHSGMLVLLDYGFEREEYYRPDRMQGTLRGYFLVEDPLLYPGLMDLTASVDFTQLAEAAVNHGFHLAGYTTQANFLIDQGLAEVGQDELASNPESDRARIGFSEAVKLLTDPAEMGESIKVAVLTKDRELNTRFSKDLRYRL